MDIFTSPSAMQLGAIAAAGWLFALSCFIGFHRAQLARTRAVRLQVLSRPSNVIDIDELRDRRDQIKPPRAV